MGIPAFDRASKRILARLGEDALLRGAPTLHRVNIERSVELVGDNGQVTVANHVATISNEDAPMVNDILVVAGVTYRLDVLLADNGYNKRFVLLVQ
jgi:hypothetical protein